MRARRRSPNEKPGVRALEDAPTIKRITELAQTYPRRGCRRLYDRYERAARENDPYMNYKRFRRLYRLGNLQISKRRRRSRAKYIRGVVLRRSDRPNDIWTMDFVSDRLLHGRVFRALTLLDECSRYALAVQPEFSYPSASVVRTLEQACFRSTIATERTHIAILSMPLKMRSMKLLGCHHPISLAIPKRRRLLKSSVNAGWTLAGST